METVSTICAFLVMVDILVFIWAIFAFIFKIIRRKPSKVERNAIFISILCFFVLVLVGTFTSPSTYCEHEWKLIESESPLCEESGYKKYHCNLCDMDRTETIKKLGHEMTDSVCNRCGYREETKPTKGSKIEASKMETKGNNGSVVVDGETIYGLYEVLSAVGIDAKDAENIKKIEDWRLGPRYSFPTCGTTAKVACNMDGTINYLAIGNGESIFLYQQGFETWHIENFIIDEDAEFAAIERTKELVKACLNYPATADFPWLDWSVGRNFNWYSVSSHVEAKNGFGVESEIPFTAIFWVEGNTIKPIYLQVNGNVVRDDREDYPLPERKEVELKTTPTADGEIRIIDGQLGEYGKEVQLDSYMYEWYMVPAGTYEATSNVKTCTVYVDKNEITRNAEGYAEAKNVSTYTWNYGETITIVIGEDEHLFNVYGADYTLKRVE